MSLKKTWSFRLLQSDKYLCTKRGKRPKKTHRTSNKLATAVWLVYVRTCVSKSSKKKNSNLFYVITFFLKNSCFYLSQNFEKKTLNWKSLWSPDFYLSNQASFVLAHKTRASSRRALASRTTLLSFSRFCQVCRRRLYRAWTQPRLHENRVRNWTWSCFKSEVLAVTFPFGKVSSTKLYVTE